MSGTSPRNWTLPDDVEFVVHADCPDGMASAILLADAYPSASVHILSHAQLGAFAPSAKDHGRCFLFCDIAPPLELAPAFAERGYCLDHHASAKESVAAFGDRGVFADEKTEPGVSGAVLAHRHVWTPRAKLKGGVLSTDAVLRAGAFAWLAGLRDTWQTGDPSWERACEQAAALMFFPADRWLDSRETMQRGAFETFQAWGPLAKQHEAQLALGPLLIQKQRIAAAKALGAAVHAARVSAGGVAWAVVLVEGCSVISDAAEMVVAPAIVGAFEYVSGEGTLRGHVVLRCSFRIRAPLSVTELPFTCADIVKPYGGGGHAKAAGCTVVMVGSPHEMLERMICDAAEAAR